MNAVSGYRLLAPHPAAARRVSAYLFDLVLRPTMPGNLGFCRLLFFGLMFWFHWHVDFSVWASLPRSFDNNPFPLFDLLHLPMRT